MSRGTTLRILRLAVERPALGRLLVAEIDRLAELRRRQLERLLGEGKSFGNISAWRGELSRRENKERMARLRRRLEQMGYRPVESSAAWEDRETGKVYRERSFLVPGARPEDLFELGREFDQDSVIFKSPQGVLGMYDTRGENPKVVLAQRPDGEPAYRIQAEKPAKRERGPEHETERVEPELFSRTRGINFEFDFQWDRPVPFDGETPMSRGRMEEVVGISGRKQDEGEGEDAEKLWDTYLGERWDGGEKEVANTNPESRDRHPKVEMRTLMRTDETFRRRVRQDFRRWREEQAAA